MKVQDMLYFSMGIVSGFVFILLVTITGCESKPKVESRTAILPYYNEGTFTPKWLYPGTDQLANFHKVPDFSLTNQEGESFSEKNLEGKIYIADFFFTTCPGICPKMTTNMSLLQEAYLDDDEVYLISHSVMPELDTVEVLKRYAEEKGINSRTWHLLTGDRAQIYDLGRYQYFVEEDLGLEKDPDDFLHTENFVLVDKNKHIRGIYNGLNKTALKQLIADVETLKKEG